MRKENFEQVEKLSFDEMAEISGGWSWCEMAVGIGVGVAVFATGATGVGVAIGGAILSTVSADVICNKLLG